MLYEKEGPLFPDRPGTGGRMNEEELDELDSITGEDDNNCELPEPVPTFGNTLYENDGEDAGPVPPFEVEVRAPTSGPVAAVGVDEPDAGTED